jgi:3-deoxy-manno-octulosonate cytidylyltransferase (CMP-KDO synthetase)
MQRVVGIIPARYNATRFVGKPLALLKGKPLIQHVYERATHAPIIDEVIVATDDERIYKTVEGFGGRAVMTSDKHASGTDRIAEVARNLKCELVINIQGDEPFIRPEMMEDVVSLLLEDERASISTLVKRITDINEILSPNVVKVVFDSEGFALYFSRAPIPYHRDEFGKGHSSHHPSLITHYHWYKHIGIYGYRRNALLKLASTKQHELEIIEKLEQLRALVLGMKIKVKETIHDTLGIDTIEDLRKAEEWLSLYS